MLMEPAQPPLLRLGILALDGCLLSSVAGPIDALQIAEKIANLRQPSLSPRFVSHVLSARGQSRVRTSNGLVLEGIETAEVPLDVLLVPGIMADQPHAFCARADDFDPEIDYLQRRRASGVRVAASCSGTLLLARSGLLDGRRATTSWWLGATFRKFFPAVNLDIEQMLVEDEGVLTTGAATAVLNLVLRLIGEVAGDDLAQQVGRMLAIDTERQSQAPYVSMAMLERPRTSLAEKAERYLRHSVDADISVSALAEHCDTSERSLLRHFKSHYGMTPLEHIQRLRVERAKALLETTHLSFDEVVERCGYSDVSSFRKLFKRATALTPADYRERFRLRARA
jgi:transcriptional regulator GlxA family with amidase domain